MIITSMTNTSYPITSALSSKKPVNQERKPDESEDPEALLDSTFPIDQNEDRELIQQCREAFRLTDKDNVQIYVVPKGYQRLKPGSFIHQPSASAKTQQLVISINQATRQIQELQNGISGEALSEDEKAQQIALLRNNLQEYKKSLSREQTRLSKLPRSGYIIIERNE